MLSVVRLRSVPPTVPIRSCSDSRQRAVFPRVRRWSFDVRVCVVPQICCAYAEACPSSGHLSSFEVVDLVRAAFVGQSGHAEAGRPCTQGHASGSDASCRSGSSGYWLLLNFSRCDFVRLCHLSGWEERRSWWRWKRTNRRRSWSCWKTSARSSWAQLSCCCRPLS